MRLNLLNLILIICFQFYLIPVDGQTVVDIDGNHYRLVTIGKQTWMSENLKVTHYRNGDEIQYIEDSDTWSRLNSGAYCVYDSTSSNIKVYGLIYNWYAVMDKRNLCPVGFHVPSDAEWTELTEFVGGELVAGGKLKEKGRSHWRSPNSKATNESEFTALPGGFRNYDGVFYDMGYYGFWWTSTKSNAGLAWGRGMYYFYGDVNRDNDECTDGFSVRCIKDH